MFEQVRRLDQLIVVNRAQGIHFTFQLRAFLNIFVRVNESMIPPEVNPIDDFLNLGHAFQRCRILDPILHRPFDSFTEILRYGQAG
ncbi:MAG: hypothetical protein OZ934_00530 [Anaerolineae bacterium]|nr:hypothetical protein [Anaerolineae bacterium]